MKIKIITDWKLKEQNLLALEAEYIKRLRGWQVEFAKSPEAEDFLIALDENGENPTTEQLAKYFRKWREDGKKISFIIGGADGLRPEQLKRANYKLSFGALTWPHKFVRVMLAEQIYRIWSILNNHPYHRE